MKPKPKASVAKKPAKAPALVKKAKPAAPKAPAADEEKTLPKEKSDSSASAPAKRKRNSNPLFAEITLGKLIELMKGDKEAKVTASRNFLLAQGEAALRAKAAADLGI